MIAFERFSNRSWRVLKEQIPRTDAVEGHVCLFIVDSTIIDKPSVEQEIAQMMAEVTSDTNWNTLNSVKILILEHHMAAKRMGFLELYEPLYRDERLRIGLLDGTLSGLRLFSERVLRAMPESGVWNMLIGIPH